MLNNKKFNIVLSLLIAIGIWAYVIGETNPADTKTFRDIPITLINGHILDESGLAVRDVSVETVNVSLTGSRADINKIDEEDIAASVDLSDAAMGENHLRVDIRIPDSAELEDKSVNKVTVTVERKVSKEFDIRPEYAGNFTSEQEPITVEMNHETVTVTGAESLVDKVDHVCAKVGSGEVTKKMKTINSELTPVDKNNQRIDRLKLSSSSVQITAQLAVLKTVKLEVPVEDRSNDAFEKKVSVPKTITVKGCSRDVDAVSTITAAPVDITEIENNAELEIVPVLPEGVQISDKSKGTLVAKITVTKLEEKVFTFKADEIILEGLSEELEAKTEEQEIKVTISGKAEELSEIEKEDIILSADLSDFSEGTHRAELTVECRKDCAAAVFEPERIRVTINFKKK